MDDSGATQTTCYEELDYLLHQGLYGDILAL